MSVFGGFWMGRERRVRVLERADDDRMKSARNDL
jgi:hypothetical protein